MDQRTPRQPSCVLSEPDQQSRWREPVVPDHFGTGTGFMEEKFFHGPDWGWGWFQDDSSALHLLCS